MAVGRRFAGLVLIACLLAGVALTARAPAARADADPASDTLLVQDAFYPYTPSTPPALQSALGTALKEIRAQGIRLDVAIIGSPVDLGGIPELFGHVDQYARFLDTELSYRRPQPLLVVMPDGLAARDAGPTGALAKVTVDRSDGSAGLARTAVTAVETIAEANGHPIAPPSLGGASSGGGGSVIVIVIPAAVLLLLLLAGGITARVLRGRAVPARG